MIRSNVVTGVMSFAEMDAMMYKIEGEDLYLIGTSEHSMIGKFIDTIIPEATLPQTLTSYSPCFRKEKGAHGIEERGVYRIHQFEKQEMIVVCKPEDSKMWFDKLWQNTVDLFRSLDVPVRTLECCSGDLADLKVKSVDVEAWSPRQKKYFEVGSCSNLGEAQARRLKMRVKGEDGNYLPHTLINTVVAPPRMLIAFLENNLNADGSVNIPKVLRPYMGGKDKTEPLSERLFTNRNLILFFVLTAILCIAAIVASSRAAEGGRTAVVRKNGEVIYNIDLDSVNEPYTIDTGGNVLLVEKGQISVLSADCPDGLCVKQGVINKHSQTIVCLPNRLTVSIEDSKEEPEPDAVVR